jgi:hypothetical protein
MKRINASFLFILFTAFSSPGFGQSGGRWSESQAGAWYKQQPWLVGSNYIPATAINELEMWQPDTFDPKQIDKELGWAEAIGMNTMRVFLHDLMWQDPEGSKKRMDAFLTLAAKHRIRPLFVLFDSCWDPNPKLGVQHPPIPGVHNSGWLQSPGREALADSSQYPRLKTYVAGVVGAFAADSRILGWDLWNEPDNGNSAYAKQELKDKATYVAKLLPQAFAWAREAHASQPLTSGVWEGDLSSLEKASPVARIQLSESDVISFHDYEWPEGFEQRVKYLQQYHRPLICTEYMARGAGSTFDTILPLAKKYNVGAINWGLVAGKTQTNLPWDSWIRPYTLYEPPIWFHEVFRTDGKPYREREVQLFRDLTASNKGMH